MFCSPFQGDERVMRVELIPSCTPGAQFPLRQSNFSEYLLRIKAD